MSMLAAQGRHTPETLASNTTAFALGYFLLTTVAAPLMFLVASVGYPYTKDPVMMGAHTVGAIALLAYFLGRAGQVKLAALFLTGGTTLTIMATVVVSSFTPYSSWIVYYLVIGPMMAGFLLRPWQVALIGAGSLSAAFILTSLHLIDRTVGVNAIILCCGTVLIMATNAWTRESSSMLIEEQSIEISQQAADMTAVLDASTEAIIGFDNHECITVVNRAGEQLLTSMNVTPKPGTHALYLMPEQWQMHLHGGIAAASSGKGQTSIINWNSTSYEVTVEPIRAGHGFLVSARDVTLRMRQERLDRDQIAHDLKVEQLEQLNEFKTKLLNMAGEGLTSPLGPIRHSIQELQKTGNDPAIRTLDENTQALTRVVMNMVDVARLEAGQLRIEREPLDLFGLVRDEVQNFRDRHPRITFQVEGPESVWIRGDAPRLAQGLQNLLANAASHAKHVVLVRCQITESQALVQVIDDGSGFDPALKDEIWKPFTQAGTETGSGLGLHITQGIVRSHGGDVRATSGGTAAEGQLGSGATFTFWVPRT